jgi:ATP-dependent DNA helicase HFM1/MER3
MELQMAGNRFALLHNAVLLHKCLQSRYKVYVAGVVKIISYLFRLWENSKYVSKQLDKIGLMLSTTLVNAGLTSFNKIQTSRPRELEMVRGGLLIIEGAVQFIPLLIYVSCR